MPRTPSYEERRNYLEGRQEPALPRELIELLLRLHSLRLEHVLTLKQMASKTLELDPGGRKWSLARVDEQLKASPHLVVPAPALRTAIIQLAHPQVEGSRGVQRNADKRRRELTREIDQLADAAEQALHPETDGNPSTSKKSGRRPWGTAARRSTVLGISAAVLVVLGLTVPVVPGAVERHARFEQCTASKALTAVAERGPARTVAQAVFAAAPPPTITRYAVRNAAGALQANVVFTSSAQAARGVLDDNRRFYDAHRVIDNDYTVSDTTVVTPQTPGPRTVAGECAVGA